MEKNENFLGRGQSPDPSPGWGGGNPLPKPRPPRRLVVHFAPQTQPLDPPLPTHKYLIDKIENVQRQFTKRITSISYLSYPERLSILEYY